MKRVPCQKEENRIGSVERPVQHRSVVKSYVYAIRFERVREENITRKRSPLPLRKNMKYNDQGKINLLIFGKYCPGVYENGYREDGSTKQHHP